MKIFIKKLDCTKASEDTDIPSSIINENADTLANKAVSDCEFPTSFKNTNVLPIYKKDSRLKEKNYRAINICPNLKKIYESIMHSQISAYFDKILFKHQFGFR